MQHQDDVGVTAHCALVMLQKDYSAEQKKQSSALKKSANLNTAAAHLKLAEFKDAITAANKARCNPCLGQGGPCCTYVLLCRPFLWANTMLLSGCSLAGAPPMQPMQQASAQQQGRASSASGIGRKGGCKGQDLSLNVDGVVLSW